MSNTRHAAPGAPLRQERFCSSTELEPGLMANLVAKRYSVLSDPADRELVYFVQFISHERGLKQLAAEMIQLHPNEIATSAMQKIGTSGRYDSEQVREVRRQLPAEASGRFLLRGEKTVAEISNLVRLQTEPQGYRRDAEETETESRIASRPESYEAAEFVKLCRNAARDKLPDYLTRLCLDPSTSLDRGPWYFPTLITRLRDYLESWAVAYAESIVPTEISRRVIDTIDYSMRTRCLTLTQGIEGIGKTWAARNYALQRPGRMRYVQVPATDDEAGFYREIAKALGVSTNPKQKAREFRERIEDVLEAGDLGIVFDEAHWLFGINSTRGGLPKRMLWVLTALVNKEVPIAFVATPQFDANQKFIKEHTRWRDGQLNGRIGHVETLPSVLSKEELAAVVRAKLPAADVKSATLIALFARNSDRCLGALDAVVKRARFHAQKHNRSEPNRADIAAVVLERGGLPDVQKQKAGAPERCNTPATALPNSRAITPEVLA